MLNKMMSKLFAIATLSAVSLQSFASTDVCPTGNCASVDEPSALALLAVGAAVMAFAKYKNRNQ